MILEVLKVFLQYDNYPQNISIYVKYFQMFSFIRSMDKKCNFFLKKDLSLKKNSL